MVEFVGRGGLVSDLCGEKLTEAFVEDALGDEPGFAMVAPVADASGYALFLDAAQSDDRSAASRAHAVEQRLTANPQYAYARRLGQLAPLKAVRVVDPLSRYCDRCTARGQRVGEIKPAALRREADWEMVMLGPAGRPATPDTGRMTRTTEGCL
jgi:hypothetical protein